MLVLAGFNDVLNVTRRIRWRARSDDRRGPRRGMDSRPRCRSRPRRSRGTATRTCTPRWRNRVLSPSDRAGLSRLGAAARLGVDRSRRPAVRVGPGVDRSGRGRRRRIRPRGSSNGPIATVADSEAFYDAPPCDDYALDGDRLTFPSAIDDAASREQPRAGAVLPRAVAARAAPRRAGAAAVERRRRRPRRPVPAAEPVPAVARCA